MDLGLGFDMIRLLKTTLMILLSFSVASCLQPPSTTDDNGPAVAAEEVQAEIFRAWDGADLASIRLNEFLYIEQDQKISTLEPRVVYKESTQVTGRDVHGSEIDLKMLIRSTSLENGSFKPITSVEDIMTVANTQPPAIPTSTTAKGMFPETVEALQNSMQNGTVGLRSGESRNHFLGLFAVQNMMAACVRAADWDVTCHNLQVSEGVRGAPTGVSSQPDCGGLPNCELRYKKVSFELVVNLKDADGSNPHAEKVVYEMVFSPDVPYLSHLLDFCYQGMIPTANQKVVVKICNRVQNFQVGDPNP